MILKWCQLKKPDLSVDIAGLKLRNPLILGSGSLSYTGRGLRKLAEAGFGAVVGKTVTPTALKGNPHPRVVDVCDSYVINAEGLPNPGYKTYKKEIKLAKLSGVPIIASVTEGSPEEYAKLGAEMENSGADAIELNLCCPHRPDYPYGIYWTETPERLTNVIKTVKEHVNIPVWPKIGLVGDSHLDLVKVAEKAGADAVVLIPIVTGMLIDIETGKPRLGRVEGTGSVTGPAIKPAGLRYVADAARLIRSAIIGTGGVSNGHDVIEYLMAGAKGVEIYTVVMRKGFTIVRQIINEVERFMTKKGYTNIKDIIGSTLRYFPPT